MTRLVGVGYLSTLHVNFDDTETTYQIGIDIINADAADSLVTSNGFAVQGRNIDDISVGFYQVDIRVVIDGY